MIKNNADKVYQDLLKNILTNGRRKGDRTGTGTISIPHASIEFDMSEGFPLLTTKKLFTRGIIVELLWFLQGDTNIKTLVDQNANFWCPDTYREFKKKATEIKEGYLNGDLLGTQPHIEAMFSDPNKLIILTLPEFIEKIKTDEGFAKEHGDLGPVYGKQWVNWTDIEYTDSFGNNQDKGINQVQQVMDKLLTNPDDRRMIVSAWNVAEINDMALPACHMDYHLYTEELTDEERYHIWFTNNYETGIERYFNKENLPDFDNDYYTPTPERKISLIWDQRSCDTFLGIPFNIACYGILLHMFAQQANMVPDKLVGHLKNVHIYSNHVEQCEELISRDPKTLPQLELEKAKDLFSYSYDNIKFVNYNPHPLIKGTISV